MAPGAADFVQPSPAEMGGISELAKVSAIAAARHVAVTVHTFYDGPERQGAAVIRSPCGRVSAEQRVFVTRANGSILPPGAWRRRRLLA